VRTPLTIAWIGVTLAAWAFLATPAAAEELVLWHAYTGAEREALEQAVERYNTRNPGAPIVPTALPYGCYTNKLRSAIPRGNGPDLFISGHDQIGGWVDAGLLHPMEPDPQLLPQALQAVQYGEQSWGCPLACKVAALYYNPQLIDAPPATRDEMMALARQHTTGETFGLAYEASNFYYNAGWFLGAGGEFFGDEGAITLDTPAMVEMLSFARDVVYTERVCPEEATSVLVAQLFNEGRAAMVINGPWFLSQLDQDTPRAVAPLPAPAKPLLTVETLFIPATASDPGASLAAAAALAGPDYDDLRVEVGQQVLARPADYRDPVLAAFAAGVAEAVATPSRPQMSLMWEPSQIAIRKVLRGAATPEEAAEFAQRRAEILNRPLPPQASPWPTLVVLGLLCLAGAVWAVRRTRGKKVGAQMWQARSAYAYLAPAVVAMLLLVVLPFVTGSALSLFAHRAGEYRFVGLANFWSILTSQDYAITDPLSFWFTLGVTTLWTALNVFFHVSIGMALALLLRDPWMKLRGIYRVLLIVPWAVPNYITALIWKGMFNKQFGAINGLLELLGLEPVAWFSGFWTALAANVCTNTWLGFPFMMVVTLGALQSIPRDLEEAAEVDGASRWQRFRHVTLPLLRPALLPAVVLGTVWTFNMFNIIYLVSGGEPDGATEILISEAYRWAFTREAQYGYAAAYAVMIFGVLVMYTQVTDRLTRRYKEV